MKNLETEYITKVESEVPDLWDRINASLDEEENKAPKKSRNKKIIMVRFGEIAAVAACLIITVAVIKNRPIARTDYAAETAAPCYEASESAAASDEMNEAPKIVESAVESATAGNVEKAESAAEGVDPDDLIDEETQDLPYALNDDGTYSYEGNTYQYKLELLGTSDDGEFPVSVVILSNREDITFDEVINASEDTEDFVIIEFY